MDKDVIVDVNALISAVSLTERMRFFRICTEP